MLFAKLSSCIPLWIVVYFMKLLMKQLANIKSLPLMNSSHFWLGVYQWQTSSDLGLGSNVTVEAKTSLVHTSSFSKLIVNKSFLESHIKLKFLVLIRRVMYLQFWGFSVCVDSISHIYLLYTPNSHGLYYYNIPVTSYIECYLL